MPQDLMKTQNRKDHLGNLVMFHWVAAKQYSVLLHGCLLRGHIISPEH